MQWTYYFRLIFISHLFSCLACAEFAAKYIRNTTEEQTYAMRGARYRMG